jgi:hypothetical protein
VHRQQCAEDWRDLPMKDVILPGSRHPATANLLRETRPTWGVGDVNLLPSLLEVLKGGKKKRKKKICFFQTFSFFDCKIFPFFLFKISLPASRMDVYLKMAQGKILKYRSIRDAVATLFTFERHIVLFIRKN